MILNVELIGDRDIVVSNPLAGFSVTYRKEGDAPMLVALDDMGRFAGAAELTFWAEAWKAVHKKACAVGWLNS